MSVWDRQRDETAKAYQAFRTYRDLPPETRSLDAAYRTQKGRTKATKRAPGTWRGWYRRWDWRSRVSAWDQHLESMKMTAMSVAVEDAAAKWSQRREFIPEDEFQAASELMKTVRDRLQEGRLTNAAHALEIASRVMRRSANLPVEITASEPVSVDVFFTSDQELADRMPAGATQAMPPDPCIRPTIVQGNREHRRQQELRQPDKPMRPEPRMMDRRVRPTDFTVPKGTESE